MQMGELSNITSSLIIKCFVVNNCIVSDLLMAKILLLVL